MTIHSTFGKLAFSLALAGTRRIEELDRLFKRIYEDNVNGKLSDSRFQMLSDDYEQEQEELREKLLQLNEEIIQQEEQAENIDRFISKVRDVYKRQGQMLAQAVTLNSSRKLAMG